MKTLRYFLLFSIVAAFLFTSCESLEVENLNDPDFETAFSNPSDVKGVAGSLMNTWYMTVQNYNGIALGLWVAADAGTCSWGNAGMRDLSYEPRIAWDNTAAYSNANVTETVYKWLYAGLASANEVLGKVVVGDMVIETEDGTDETPMVAAFAHLAQGLNLGYIGLLYDKGYITTENTDLTQTLEVYPWNQVIDTAVMCLDKCIAICATNTFTLPGSWIPGINMTNVRVSELANTVAALLLSYSPRNKAQNDAVNWGKVLSYANKGLTYDFAPVMDDISWYNLYHTYAHYGGWGQTDMRLVNMMDPRFPARWTDAGTWDVLPEPATAHVDGIDDRIFTDFEFLETCGFRVERGYYHFSCYRSQRYDDMLATWTTPEEGFMKAENDLLKAEALMHQPDLTGAAAIINAGTRVTRGRLAPVAATAAVVEAAIFYERHIELHGTGCGLEFFIMRKANKLQAGTPLHFPIPGQQLEVNQMENYTFGPGKGVAGEDYSNGGWF
jgi:hypothetical protein